MPLDVNNIEVRETIQYKVSIELPTGAAHFAEQDPVLCRQLDELMNIQYDPTDPEDTNRAARLMYVFYYNLLEKYIASGNLVPFIVKDKGREDVSDFMLSQMINDKDDLFGARVLQLVKSRVDNIDKVLTDAFFDCIVSPTTLESHITSQSRGGMILYQIMIAILELRGRIEQRHAGATFTIEVKNLRPAVKVPPVSIFSPKPSNKAN